MMTKIDLCPSLARCVRMNNERDENNHIYLRKTFDLNCLEARQFYSHAFSIEKKST